MHGIDNFMFAKSLVFHDYDVRKMIVKLGLLDKNKKYLRFGCSGARECNFHPGGEVVESSLINGKDGSGLSQSISGYLPKNSEYSKSISLYDESKEFLREERIVYSHTAFLKECETGRVLKNMPLEPFKELQDATDIGLEKLFRLENEETMYGVGTNYLRYEPEWKEFTGGRQYERRGHIHATVIGNEENKKHEVFHLRDVFVSPASDIQMVLTPVENVYKIYPIYKKEDKFYCKTTDRDINLVIKNIQFLDKM